MNRVPCTNGGLDTQHSLWTRPHQWRTCRQWVLDWLGDDHRGLGWFLILYIMFRRFHLILLWSAQLSLNINKRNSVFYKFNNVYFEVINMAIPFCPSYFKCLATRNVHVPVVIIYRTRWSSLSFNICFSFRKNVYAWIKTICKNSSLHLPAKESE